MFCITFILSMLVVVPSGNLHFARAAKPRLVLADEPTASLDKQPGRQVVDPLRQMARSWGIPLFLETHDNRILDIADRIGRNISLDCRPDPSPAPRFVQHLP